VYMAPQKELHYFYINYDRGREWYQSHFAPGAAKKARGEISPDYMYHDVALRRIAHDLPDVVIFVILRNPVERAYSQYQLHRHRFAGRPFIDACIPGSELFDRGLYFDHMRRVLQYFSRDRIKVLLYDDLANDPSSFVADLYRHVGVSTEYKPAYLNRTVNKVIFPKTQIFLNSIGMSWIIDAVKRTPIGDRIRRFQSLNRHDSERFNVAVAQLATKFEADIRKLEQLIDRDLSKWIIRA
jgi:hypothetical protein